MDNTQAPRKTTIVFAQNAQEGTIRAVDESNDGSQGKASYGLGFPRITMMPVTEGGQPPQGPDMQGILNDLSRHAQWLDIGGCAYFDDSIRQSIGGYPKLTMLRSTRFSYVIYVCTVDNNNNNPDDYADPNLDYWISDAVPNNGWAIISIPDREDKDNILFFNQNFKAVAKLAGAHSDLYVNPFTGDDNNNGTIDAPLKTIGAAMDMIAAGATATIHLWYLGSYALNRNGDTSPPLNLGNGWGVGGGTHLTVQPYGDPVVDQYNQILQSHQSANSVWELQGITRPQITIPVGTNPVNNTVTMGFIVAGEGATVTLNALHFVVSGTSSADQNASPFHPYANYRFSGCLFSNIANLKFLFGGWGGSTSAVAFSETLFLDKGNVFVSGSGYTTITCHDDHGIGQNIGLESLTYNGGNQQDYLSRPSHYYAWHMEQIGYTAQNGGDPIWAPAGIKINVSIKFNG